MLSIERRLLCLTSSRCLAIALFKLTYEALALVNSAWPGPAVTFQDRVLNPLLKFMAAWLLRAFQQREALLYGR